MSQEIAWSNRYRDAGEQYLFGTEPNADLPEVCLRCPSNHMIQSLYRRFLDILPMRHKYHILDNCCFM